MRGCSRGLTASALDVLSAQLLLDWFETLLLRTGGVPSTPSEVSVRADDQYGSLDLRLNFSEGHTFTASITIDVSDGDLTWVSYRFYLQDGAGRCVFRYDDSAHYPEMPTFPHHKHVGPDERAESHPRPSLHQILAEVRRHVRR
jgi:hypothetical protein